jgi:hypothetical protein
LHVRLVGENGKLYLPQVRECKTPVVVTASSYEGGIVSFPVCYWVEKELNDFKIQYYNEVFVESYQIGEITLNKQLEPKTVKSPEIKQSPDEPTNDIFSQILNMIKKWFGFI